MSKNTDYKNLWRKAKEENIELSNAITELKQLIGKYEALLKKIKPKAKKGEAKQ